MGLPSLNVRPAKPDSAGVYARHRPETTLRDYALLLFLYNTGARVQEVVDLQINDVHHQTPLQVRIIGRVTKNESARCGPKLSRPSTRIYTTARAMVAAHQH